jgi:protein TonB
MSASVSARSWTERSLGMPRALILASVMEVLVLTVWLWHAPQRMQSSSLGHRQVTAIDFVQLPVTAKPKPAAKAVAAPAPPKRPSPRVPPKSPRAHPVHVPPPKPTPRPDLARQRIAPPAPPPYRLRREKPAPPPERSPAPPAPRKPAAPVAVIPPLGPSPSVIAAYGQRLHALIQRHVQVDPVVSQFDLSGRVKVAFVLDADGGRAREVRVVAGGANRLIRRNALASIEQLTYPPFPKSFGPAPRRFEVVVRINMGN